MPKVPGYESQIETRPIAGQMLSVGSDLGSFGGGSTLSALGAAKQDLGDTIRNIGIGIKKAEMQAKFDADKVRVQDVVSETLRIKKDLMDNPEYGVSKKLGFEAVSSDVVGNTEKSFKSRTDLLLKNLDESQRKMADPHIRQIQNEIKGLAEEHVAKESGAYQHEVAINATAILNDDAVRNPSKAQRNLAEIRGIVDKTASELGRGKEWADRIYSENVSNVHKGIVNRMIDSGQTEAAKAYFAKHRTEINEKRDPGGMTKTQEALQDADIKIKAKYNAEALLLDFKDDEAGALAKANDMDDTGKTAQALSKAYKELKEIDWHEDNKRFNQASRAVEAGKDVDSTIWVRLSHEDKRNLTERLEQVRSGKNVDTDVKAYYFLKNLAAEDPNKFLKENLERYNGKLAPRERQEIQKLQIGLDSQDNRTRAKLDGYLTDRQSINTMLGEVGIKSNSNDARLFHSKVDELVRQEELQTGKQVNKEGLKKIADKLLIEGEVGYWNRNKRLFQAKPGDNFRLDIDTKTRKDIVSAIEAAGKKATEEEIIKTYSNYQRAQKKPSALRGE